MEKGFYKVEEMDSLATCVVTIYNPERNIERVELVRSANVIIDKELIELPIDENAYRAWRHSKGELLEGDKVVVSRGRPKNIKKGDIAIVFRTEPYIVNGKVKDICVWLSGGGFTYARNLDLVA